MVSSVALRRALRHYMAHCRRATQYPHLPRSIAGIPVIHFNPVPVIVGSVVLATAWPCQATPDFPAVVQQFVSAPSSPSCTICHNNPNGGIGTATQPFAEYLRSRGLVAYDENSLRTALTADEAENQDSNSDGVSDIDALKQGLDPNGASGAKSPPEFGCQIAHAGDRDHSEALAVLGGALACLFLRRRPRTPSRQSS